MRTKTKSKTCLKSTRISNSILEKHLRLRKVLPKPTSDELNTSPNQQQPSNFKELEFIINKDNPTIVEYYINNNYKDNNNICVLNYCNYKDD